MILKSLENELVQYTSIVFLQDSEADEPLKILSDDGEQACIDFLQQWDCGDSPDVSIKAPWGGADDLFRIGNYVVSHNSGLQYIALTRVKVLDAGELMESIISNMPAKKLLSKIYTATNGYRDIWESLEEAMKSDIEAAALEA